MKRILISDPLSPEGIEVFKRVPGIEVDVRTNLKPEELKVAIKDYDGLVIRSATKVTREIIEQAQNLKVIGRAGSGLDNVDIVAASKRGIVVMNTPGGNTITTAEHAIALMLSLSRSIPQATASMKAGKWEKNKFVGRELFNKKLGVIGIGQVGSVVADRAQGLKMQVIAYDPFIAPEAAEKLGVSMVSYEELLETADFITVHTPLSKDTRGLINAAAFARMKPGVYIINCARGGIVSERDLLDALNAGKVAGAALDVFEEEPTKNMDLVCHPNVICTPHLGASTDEAQINVAIAIAEQIVAYLTIGEIRNAVNFPSISAELLTLIEPYLDLAEKLGKFHAQITTGGIQEVTVEYSGKILDYDVAPLTIALLKGILTPSLGDTVNFINAPLLAKEREIDVVEAKSSGMKDYTSLISLTTKTTKEKKMTAGALFGLKDPRIVRIDDFVLDVVPEGYMLVVYNEDRPGVVGNIGSTLGRENINIARLHLSREQKEKQALVVLSTDTPVPTEVIDKLRALPHVISVTALEM